NNAQNRLECLGVVLTQELLNCETQIRGLKGKSKVFLKLSEKDYTAAKSFSPISLTSFNLKEMEKIINICVRTAYIRNTTLLNAQHAYRVDDWLELLTNNAIKCQGYEYDIVVIAIENTLNDIMRVIGVLN
ncbi:unnamed protein product, partial [Ceratitis capitata]